MLTACTAGDGPAVAGLPSDAFERSYAVGYDVAAAERCGETIDAGAVRYRLVENLKGRGYDEATAEKGGRTFDKTRAELTRKLKTQPEFCVSQYALSPEALALYRKGEFPADPRD